MSTAAEREARALAEASREKWRGESFLRDLFLGDLRLDLVTPYPRASENRPAFESFYRQLETLLHEHVDPARIDETGEYPKDVIDRLAEIGAFGMKIPVDYGGLGLTYAEYVKAMTLLGSYDANLTALLSAHQSIGVPQPVRLFGSEHLKRKYLPMCAAGAISAFALTEPAVGSDPGRLGTTARRAPDGSHYVLDGEKLWCTNGTIAKVLVVMARDADTGRIHCFVVETGWKGVTIEHRCHFMGLRALANAQIGFRGVEVPAENMIGGEGEGLKIALVTLNTGRVSLPAATTGGVKHALEVCRKWANAREQWGHSIGRHEAIAHRITDMAGSAFAMESVSTLVGDYADREGFDIRLEAAAAKEWCTATMWEQINSALQIRGGRGYETERSLEARGEPPIGIERMVRDCRINLIFEGSSEIMHLFVAREAVDKHLEIAGKLVDPDVSTWDRLRAIPTILAFYAWWYPSRWIGWGFWPRFRRFGPLARHVRFLDRATRRLARAIFHAMLVYRGGLERKQALLFRVVDIAMELFVIASTVSRADDMRRRGDRASDALALTARVVESGRARVSAAFRALFRNDDARRYAFAKDVLEGRYRWLEAGIIGLPFEEADLTPPTVEEILRDREAESPSGPRAHIVA